MDEQTIEQAYRQAVGYHQAGRLGEAEALYRRILVQHPAHAESLQMLGVLAHQAGHSDAAIRLLTQAIALNPSSEAFHVNLGVVLAATNHPDEAIACYRRALDLSPNHPEALANLGTLLHEQGRSPEAVDLLSRAAALHPDKAEAHRDLGIALREVGRLDDAISEFRRALALSPSDHIARWSLGFTQLLLGDLEAGWPNIEARWQMKGLDPQRRFPQPLWDGRDPSGRRILLWAEQGLGDTIQFIRYVPLLAARGARVAIACQPELQRLLRAVEGVEDVINFSDPPPPFDVHAPFMSLPRLLGTTLATVPANAPYLRADPVLTREWRSRVRSAGAGLKIGLAWAGSPTHKNDSRRSLALADLTSLAGIHGVQFFSLQKGPASGQVQSSTPLNILDWTTDLTDFAETAALLVNLDLVITVDTSVAHLAGALARPVWVLVPFAPDWRWMLDRTDSPWYPTMRLFRQSQPGNWSAPVDQVRRALGSV